MYFVIGPAIYGLRLTALEMIGISYHAKQIDGSTPLTGRQPKPEAQPATDQMPKNADSVATHRQNLIQTDWANKGGPGLPALFW